MLQRFPIRMALCAGLGLALVLAPAWGANRQDARALSPEEIRALVDRAITNQHRNEIGRASCRERV